MKRFPKFLVVALPILLVVGLILSMMNVWLVDALVEMGWYKSLGYLKFFFAKIGYKYLVLVGVTLAFFAFLFLNFFVASRYLGVTKFHKETRMKKLIQGFRSGSMKVYIPVALILAVMLALPIYQEWEKALLYFFSENTGDVDSLFKLDVSFYLFALPVIQLVYGRVLLTLVILLAALVILYAAELKMLSKEGQPLYRGAKFHLSFVVGLIFLVHALGYGLEALMLQYTTNNIDRFYGPGFTEYYFNLPLLAVAAFMVLPLALSVIALIWRQKGIKTVVLFVILAALAHGFRNFQPLFDSVYTVIVKPNEFDKQEKFIKQSIQSTLIAYQLNDVERRSFEQHEFTDPRALTDGIDMLNNIPLWDNELLQEVYHQRQSITPYYTITGVDAARYTIDDDLHQVYLAAREINVNRLAAKAKSWPNLHLRYTHGYGVVMTPAAQIGEQEMEFYIKNMPPESPVGLEVNRPSIYYGLEDLEYVIAPNKQQEFHFPGEDDTAVEINYEGEGGVPCSGFFRKALFSLYFNDWSLFLTQQMVDDSKIHFRRHIMERIRELTPFFQLDESPYLVVTPDRLYWMVDAYTTSKWYPNAQPFSEDLNYIRNSIKIVVDAYDGSVDYYLVDDTDPIGKAYQEMYKGLIKDLDEMPEALQKQIRYPRNLFEIQMQMFAVYHQETPRTFYDSQDRMRFAEFTHQDDIIQMRPYYITLDLIEPGKREFLMLTPLLPYVPEDVEMSEDRKLKELGLLRALAVARSDVEHYGDIIFYTFPKGSQIFGPPQVNALIDQNTVIAQSITLWNQQGSQVKRGKMIMLPMDGRIVYIQPFYMQASGDLSIPQLKRVIVCVDEQVVMDVSIEKAMRRIYNRMADNQTTPMPELNDIQDAGNVE